MEKLMLAEFIGHLQDTLEEYGDMPISKLSYFEGEDGNAACEIVDVGGFVVNEPSEGGVLERTLVILDDEEVTNLEGGSEETPTIQ
jgi:hypothetical protein